MNILVTGSEGFIGKKLCNALENKGYLVDKWDKKINRDIKDISVADISNANYVIHLAAFADVKMSITYPDLYWQNNVVYTKHLQDMCVKADRKLIFASSSCIHQWYLSPYGLSKKVNELTAHWSHVGLRFTTVYGTSERENMFMSRIINKTLEYTTPHIRDFIHVDDVVKAILGFVEAKDWKCGFFDVGTGKGYSVTELAKIAGFDVPEIEGSSFEAQNNTANLNEMFKHMPNWKPEIDVIDFINESNT